MLVFGLARMRTPAVAPLWPASQVSGASTVPSSSWTSGYSPRLQTLPASSWAMKASSSSASSPSWKSRSQITTVRTWSTHFVTLVTVKTTSWFPPVVVPVSVNCRPGTRGRNRLSTTIDRAEKFLTAKSFSVVWGRDGAAVPASAWGAGTTASAASAAAAATKRMRTVRMANPPDVPKAPQPLNSPKSLPIPA